MITLEWLTYLQQHVCHVVWQGMDTYSNVLYVKDEFAALSAMAHRAVATEKYSPESTCIVGNYYSMKGDHEKVIKPSLL
jgi:anaphase-promoting complex subunit 8